jgi:hypothetical protein
MPWRTAAALCFLLAGSLLHPGCGSSRETPRPPALENVVVVEGAQFHVPTGWLNFSRDTLRTGILWLVRRDFQATINVEEVHAGGGAADPGAAARALLRLELANDVLRVVAPPAEERDTGGRAVAFHIERRGGDEVRVAVVVKGGRIYAVTAVQTRGAPAPFADLLGVQRGIVDDLLR